MTRPILRRGVALSVPALILCATPVRAETSLQTMMRLCSSIDQSACWIKRGSQLCDDRDGTCRRVDADTPAKITRKAGSRVFVETRERSGSVTLRSIAFDRSR